MIFGFYQYWVHQNPGDHLDGVTTEYGKWQDRWVNSSLCQTNSMTYRPENLGGEFVGTLSVEINGVRAWKWDYERVIVFHSDILQRSQGVNNSKHICAGILFKMDFWNNGAFDELVKDRFNVAMGYLGKSRGIQTKEQRHRTFSNLVMKVKLREAVRFVCAR